MPTPFSPPVILMAAGRQPDLAPALEARGFVVIKVPTGKLTLALAQGAKPDLLVLEDDLPDMSGLEACRALRHDVALSPAVPVLLLGEQEGTNEERSASAEAGAQELLGTNVSVDELAQRIEAHMHNRAADSTELFASAGGTGGTTLPGNALAWRARELGALMVRMHAALSCLVFSIDPLLLDQEAVSGLATAARTSDVLGPLGTSEIGVIAPVTDHVGAVAFARRMSSVLRQRAEAAPPTVRRELRVGYAAIDNLKYSPVDPLVLMARASAAVNDGVPEAAWPWIRAARNGSTDRGHSADWTKRSPGSGSQGGSAPWSDSSDRWN